MTAGYATINTRPMKPTAEQKRIFQDWLVVEILEQLKAEGKIPGYKPADPPQQVESTTSR